MDDFMMIQDDFIYMFGVVVSRISLLANEKWYGILGYIRVYNSWVYNPFYFTKHSLLSDLSKGFLEVLHINIYCICI